jgi:hypothetical protein
VLQDAVLSAGNLTVLTYQLEDGETAVDVGNRLAATAAMALAKVSELFLVSVFSFTFSCHDAFNPVAIMWKTKMMNLFL